MKEFTDCYELAGGIQIPCIGYGTGQIPDGEEAVAVVRAAFDCGYRHIDTAAGYGNEASVGRAVRESGIAREDLFITSKLANDMHGYEDTLAGAEQSRKRLGVDYIDLYLIHWPNPVKYREHWQETNAATWRALEELQRAGQIRALGLSNFRIHHIEELKKTAQIQPAVNQIHLCPGDTQEELVEYCRRQGMLPEAYSPLGIGKIFQVPQMQELSEKYGRSIAQICIRWSLQRGYLPLPKSSTPERIRQNKEVFDFELSDRDVKRIADLKGCCGYSEDPDTAVY